MLCELEVFMAETSQREIAFMFSRAEMILSSFVIWLASGFEQESSELFRQHIFLKIIYPWPPPLFHLAGQGTAVFFQRLFVEVGVIAFPVFPASK